MLVYTSPIRTSYVRIWLNSVNSKPESATVNNRLCPADPHIPGARYNALSLQKLKHSYCGFEFGQG